MFLEINNRNVLPGYPNFDKYRTIPKVNVDDLSYGNFFENYMFKNMPCLIRNVSKNWMASQKWIRNGEVNLNYMEDNYGHTDIMIYNCSKRYFNSQQCEKGVFTEYLNYWKKKTEDNLIYYLKDWHLKLQCRNNEFYQVPIYFASDWLNEYCLQYSDDDYRFVYMGPKGSWTPLHADVFSSYSWSVNVYGRKRWIFIPPGQENNLKDNLNNLVYDINDVDFKNYIEINQDIGDAIFVPSGWYHQVWNLEDTISINHNWINGCNIHFIWDSLKENLGNVKMEIEDCKDMDNFEDHCQTMLNSLFGMDYKKFYNMLKCITHNRINAVNNPSKRVLYHGHEMGINHILFDLQKCSEILRKFANCDYVNTTEDFNDIETLISQIEDILTNKYIQ